jgi:hypothetical protein
MEPKFIIDREKVSDEEIEKNKNFDELVTKFKNQSIQKARNDRSWWKQKRIKYSAAILGVTVICTVTVSQLYNKSNKKNTNESNSTLTTNKKETTSPLAEKKLRTINPVNAKLDVPFTRYKVNAAKGGSLNHFSKSKIEVPKNAFVNKAGEVIEGEVEIMYREFHKVSETMMSGIPMRYDSAGKAYDFESAGMFDIRGEQNGEPVFINPNANLNVQLASEKEGAEFNQYFLDTINNKWEYRCEDVVQKMPAPTSTKLSSVKKEASVTKEKAQEITQATIEKEIEKTKSEGLKKIEVQVAQQLAKLPTPKAPVKPRKISNRQTFTLEVDKNEFPELSGFSNVVFEVGDENKNYSDKYTEITWNDVLIKDGPKKGENYLLNLRKGATALELVVYPCLSGADFEKANIAFKSKMQLYEKELSDRKAKEEKLREEMVARQKEYQEEMKRNKEDRLKEFIRYQKQLEAEVNKEVNQLQNMAKVMRVFQVSQFGVYNSDCPRMRDPDIYAPIIRYTINDKLFQPNQVLVIDYTTKMMYTYYAKDLSLLALNPTKRYALCIPINGGLYVKQFSANDETLTAKPSTLTLSLNPLPSDIVSIDDVKRYFEI